MLRSAYEVVQLRVWMHRDMQDGNVGFKELSECADWSYYSGGES